VDANFNAAAVLIYCFVERKSVHFAVALNQCSRALISVLRRDMTKKLPRCERLNIKKESRGSNTGPEWNASGLAPMVYVVPGLLPVPPSLFGSLEAASRLLVHALRPDLEVRSLVLRALEILNCQLCNHFLPHTL
jgi:hypothetical protein